MYQGQDNCTFQLSASKNSTKFEGKKEIDLSRKATSGFKVQIRHANYTANIYSGNWDTRKKCKSYKYLP